MNEQLAHVFEKLRGRLTTLEAPRDILRAPELRELYAEMKKLPADKRPAYGQQLNQLRRQLEQALQEHEAAADHDTIKPIDVTAPFDVNVPANKRPRLLPAEHGTIHPLSRELQIVVDIFQRMGFGVVESRQIDDDFNMFGALNFPEGHPARDDYDSFMTEEGLIAPAHTSTMQHRVLKQFAPDLETGRPIAVVLPGRVFRNEDVDPRHEHTFHQFEGVYVDKGVHAGNLLATFKTFLSEYYQQEIEIKTQPFYFPFTEPSFELALSCPFCAKKGCAVCSHTGWIELLGMGMIHPNVLKMAGIDPTVYTGFAWGCGLERLVMMKYDIDDIRFFHGGKLEFLRQFV